MTSTVATVLNTAATQGTRGPVPSPVIKAAWQATATAATSQPTPGKCALLAKTSLLAHLGTQGMVPVLTALVGGHVLSRFWPLLIIRGLPHVGDTARSKSKPLADQITLPALGAGLLWCFLPLTLVWQAQGAMFFIACAGLSALAAAWMARWFAQRLQGFTGDCLGATQQVSEIGFYLGAALALGPALA